MKSCKFFLQSKCAKGALCPFSHEEPRTIAYRPSPGPTKDVPCIYFQQGKCRNGTKCTFKHSECPVEPTKTMSMNHNGTTSLEQLATSATDTRRQIPCKFFLHGSCMKGADCPYQHPVEPPKRLSGEEQDPNSLGPRYAPDSLQRALLGAFVQFDHGAVIRKVALASDFSSVRVDSMSFTDVESVIDVARRIGVHVEPNHVVLLPMAHETIRSAQITLEDPTFAKRFCDEFRATLGLTAVAATAVSPRLPSWAAGRRVNCKKIIISWHRPTRLVWLNFGQNSVAQRVSDKFNNGQYQIAGHRVRAQSPTGVTDHRNRNGITVLLQNVPYGTTQVDVFRAIRADYDKPRHVELDRMKGLYNVEDSHILVKSLLDQFGPLEFTDVTKEDSKRFKAIALFSNENDARQAVASLHDEMQPFLNNHKLSLQLMSSSKFKIPGNVYEAVEDQFAAHIPSWREEHLSFHLYPDANDKRRFVSLKVEGESAKAVAKATSTIDEIAAGKLVEDEGKPCWNSSLVSNGPLFQQLKHIETTYGVVILRDKQKRQLRYFGPQNLYSAALEIILIQMKAHTDTARVIQLDHSQFNWASRGGFSQVSKVLGVEVATFDVTPTPKIVVTGSEEQYRKALAIVNAGSTEGITGDKRSISEEDCVICWTPAEDPVTLQCSHIYCLGCFERLCLSETPSGSDFSIKCQGGEAMCKEVVTLQELRDLLSSTALEHVLEASLASYVRHRPQELRCCPSPDCGFIYRVDATSRTHTCVKCLEPICTLCHEQHGTMSCADYKDLASGGYKALEKFKREMNIKDCPKCKTPIEKTMGCNHMTCGGCSVHFCWVCLETFKDASLCYGHLTAVHGRIADIEDILY